MLAQWFAAQTKVAVNGTNEDAAPKPARTRSPRHATMMVVKDFATLVMSVVVKRFVVASSKKSKQGMEQQLHRSQKHLWW